MKIGIISAMEPEMRALAEALRDRRSESFAGLTYYSGELDGVPCVVCECGVGKVNAAMHTQILIDRFKPDAIIMTGVAGSLSPEVGLFDTVVATELVYSDMQDFILTSFPLLSPVYKTDERLTGIALRVCRDLGIPHVAGRIATGDVFVSGPEMKADIAQRTGALCCEMEGCAVAHTAQANDVPAAILRAISDMADSHAEVDFPSFLDKAAKQGVDVVRAMIGVMRTDN